MTRDEMCTAYNLPDFDDILDDAFRERFGLNQAAQYGIACRDVGSELQAAERLGAGPFVNARIPAPNWIEYGERRRCQLAFALGYIDGAQLEFLGPGKGTGFYSDALQGAERSLHHVGVFQNDSDELEKRLNSAGFDTVVAGGVSLGSFFGFRFKYFDTRNAIGCYLEVLDFYLFDRPISIERPVKLLAGLRKRVAG